MFGGFPTTFYSVDRHRHTFEETMLIALHYQSKGTTYYEMREVYGGDYTRYSHMVNWFATFCFCKYYHRLSGRSMEYWAEDVPNFREAIWRYVCFNKDGDQDIQIDLNLFRIFGWMDCFKHMMCQPRSGPVGEDDTRHDDRFEIQRAYFTRYGKYWGMKTQALILPNGMFGSVFFTSASQNDKGVVNISGIEEELERILHNYKLYNDTVFPAFYADQIYDTSSVIVQSQGQHDNFFVRLNASRMDPEHLFGSINNLDKRNTTQHTWKIMKLRQRVREHLFLLFFG